MIIALFIVLYVLPLIACISKAITYDEVDAIEFVLDNSIFLEADEELTSITKKIKRTLCYTSIVPILNIAVLISLS